MVRLRFRQPIRRIVKRRPRPAGPSTAASSPWPASRAGRLGLLRQGQHRTRHPRRLRIRHGPRLLPSPPSSPSTRPSRASSAGTSKPSTPWAARLRQPPNRRTRPPRHRRPVPPPPARARRHYHFAPRPCTPGRKKREGENREADPIPTPRLLRRPALPRPRRNAQFRRWRDDVAHQRRHPEQPDRERLGRREAPPAADETELVRVVRSGKTPYVRFDRNLYSIPHTHVRKPLTLLASDTRVRILDQQTELARHRRTYDSGPSRTPNTWKACSPPPARPTTTRDTSPAPPPSSIARGGATGATTDDYGPQDASTTPSNDALGAAPSPTSSKPDADSADSPPLGSPCPTDRGSETSTRPHDLETYDAIGQHDPDDAAD